VLRSFRGLSSLATYLTVIARRVVVRTLAAWQHSRRLEQTQRTITGATMGSSPPRASEAEQRISDQEELERLLARLNGAEAQVVRMYHLEGKSYREISDQVGMPENTIGPTLSRARMKMRLST
jgi:RNA polymerase sigma-70 factor (ECF subfamily)